MITTGQSITNSVTGESLVFRTTSADTNGECVVVEMSDDEGAQRAIKELDRHSYGGRNLTVNEAKPMAPRGNSGGGGGFGARPRRESRW